MRKARLCRHRPDRPVRCIGRRGTQRSLDHRRDLIVVDRARPAGARFVEQPVDAVGQKAPPPLAHRVLVHAKLGGHDLAL